MKKPVWVLRKTAFRLHEQAVAEVGGESGIRDESLIDSALSEPENLFAYVRGGIRGMAEGQFAQGVMDFWAGLD
jgi:prophage maintenance system killer protein